MQVGKYQVVHHIATGGMGAVYRATDVETGRDVALKILSPEMASRTGVIERFRREAASAAKLNHENIVKLYEWGEVNGLYFLALEFVDGLDLQEYVARKGKLRAEVARTMILQAAQALAHVHEQGLVHRDIKPSNFLVMRRDRRPLVKLIDLGLAREIDTEQFRITRANHTLGTIDYMAPEQARDSGLADIRSDIYSLGCTLYHMLAGNPPFNEGGLAERLYQHAEVEPPDIRTINPDVTPGLARVLGKMLAKKPVQRYQNPQELIQDLQNPEVTQGPIRTEFLEELAHEDNGHKASRPRRSDPSAKGRSDQAVRNQRDSQFDKKAASEPEDTGDDWPEEAPRKRPFNWTWVWVGAAALFLVAVAIAVYLGLREDTSPPVRAADAAPGDSSAQPQLASMAIAPAPAATNKQATTEVKEKKSTSKNDKIVQRPRKDERLADLARGTEPVSPVPLGQRQLYRPKTPVDVVALQSRLEAPWSSAGTALARGPTVRVARGASQGGSVYSSLEKAAAAAGTGSIVIEIDDNGPLFESPLVLRGRHVVIRGGAGYHPLLAWNLDSAAAVKASGWLTVADGDLTLEDVDIVVKYPEGSSPGPTALIELQNSSFQARGCTLSVGGRPRLPVAAVRLIGPRSGRHRCRLEHCYVRGADMIAIDGQAPADILLEHCLLAGGDPPLLQIAAGTGSAFTSIGVQRSTLTSNQTILAVRSLSTSDSQPIVRWFGWDSLLTRPGDAGGTMVTVDAGAGSSGIDWQAVNCLYTGWKALLTSGQDIVMDGQSWLARWRRDEGDVVHSGTWPAVAHLNPSEVPAQEYRTENSPIFFLATGGSGGVGCDIGSLPPTRDTWPLLTYDRMVALPFEAPPPLANDPAMSDIPYERVDLATVDDLGQYVDKLRSARKMGSRLVLRVIGSGVNSSKPIRLSGVDLTLYLETRNKKSAPLVLVPLGSRGAEGGFIDIADGNLRIVGGTIRYPDSGVSGPPSSLIRVRDGQLVLHDTRLFGPTSTPPASYRALVRLESTSTPSRDGFSRTWVLHDSVLAGAGHCLEAAGCDAQLSCQNCLLVSDGEALRLMPQAATPGHANVRCFLDHTTVACRRAALRLDDSAVGSLPEPIVVQSHACAFLDPFGGEKREAGLLRYEGNALARGLLIWQGAGDAFDKRLLYAALPVKAEPTAQPHRQWTELWGSAGDHAPLLDAPFSTKTITFDGPADPEKLHLEALALPSHGKSRPAAGADFTELGIRKTRSSR